MAQGPHGPHDTCPLFADTKPSNSLIPFLSFRGSEVRTGAGLAREDPREGHRQRPGFRPRAIPQKDSAKDAGTSGEALELRPEGRRSLRLGVSTGRRPMAGWWGAWASGVGGPDPTLSLCSVPLQAVFPRTPAATTPPAESPPAKVSARWGGAGALSHSAGFSRSRLGFPPTPHPVPADRDGNGDGGTEF